MLHEIINLVRLDITVNDAVAAGEPDMPCQTAFRKTCDYINVYNNIYAQYHHIYIYM